MRKRLPSRFCLRCDHRWRGRSWKKPICCPRCLSANWDTARARKLAHDPPLYIYALVDPRTQAIRYIGRTNNLKLRLQGHRIQPSRKVGAWIQELQQNGLKPHCRLLEKIDQDVEVDAAELTWIKWAQDHGSDLLNAHYFTRTYYAKIKAH